MMLLHLIIVLTVVFGGLWVVFRFLGKAFRGSKN